MDVIGRSAARMNHRLHRAPWAGLLCVLPTAILAARLVWEQTVLSVRNGPQMVGISLVHSGIGVLLFLGPIVGLFWSVATVVYFVRRKARPDLMRLGLLGAFALCILLLVLPYGFWQRLLVKAHAHGAHVGEYVSYAAAMGDLATVKAFLAEGVQVDVRNEHDGATSPHGAAVEGQIAVIEYLLSKGADVNALNAYGDTPLHEANTMNHPDAAAVLIGHGGKDVRGSDAQRNKAIQEDVNRDIERLNHQR